MTNYYATEGIDSNKLTSDARRISQDGTLVVIHYHSNEQSCNFYRHEIFQGSDFKVIIPKEDELA